MKTMYISLIRICVMAAMTVLVLCGCESEFATAEPGSNADPGNTTGNADPARITFNVAPPPAYREVTPDGTTAAHTQPTSPAHTQPAPTADTRLAQTDAAAQWEEGDVIWMRAEFYEPTPGAPQNFVLVETNRTALIFDNGHWRPFTPAEADAHQAQHLTDFVNELHWPGTMAQDKDNYCDINARYLGKGLPDSEGKVTLDCTVNTMYSMSWISPGESADVQFSQTLTRIRITKGCELRIENCGYRTAYNMNDETKNATAKNYPTGGGTVTLTDAQDFFIAPVKSAQSDDTRILVNSIPVTLLPDADSGYYGLSYTIDPDALTNGTGTPLPPGYDLTISTADELQAFAAAVNSNSEINGIPAATAAVLQTADIDLAGIDDWEPIGNNTSPNYYHFSGIYNGNGHTISNLRIRGERGYNGLFGLAGANNDATVILTGIHLRGVDIEVNTAGDFTGGLAGATDGNNTVVSFCSAQGKIQTESPHASYAGGIVGNAEGRGIHHCRADVEVTVAVSAAETNDQACAGGIAGINNGGVILACESTAKVISAKGGISAYAGGIAGWNMVNNPLIIFCAAGTGKITATNGKERTYAGGLVGNHSYGTLQNSYSRGTATASSNTGETGEGAIIGISIPPADTPEHCFGTGTGGKGTSGLEASLDIVYKTNATDEEIYDVINKMISTFHVTTTTYDATRTPAYGIELTEQTFDAGGVWQYSASTLSLSGFPPMPPMPPTTR